MVLLCRKIKQPLNLVAVTSNGQDGATNLSCTPLRQVLGAVSSDIRRASTWTGTHSCVIDALWLTVGPLLAHCGSLLAHYGLGVRGAYATPGRPQGLRGSNTRAGDGTVQREDGPGDGSCGMRIISLVGGLPRSSARRGAGLLRTVDSLSETATQRTPSGLSNLRSCAKMSGERVA